LRETKGAVVNLGSIQSFVALPNSAACTTSKSGVRALTKALALELSPLGIRDYMKNFESRIPMGRIDTSHDVAGPAVFLASDLARYIAGVTLPVDGGYLAL
jgi:NAD(P)-dependent dehydrogenase (short-subunit alcohol dehydrogenase family)